MNAKAQLDREFLEMRCRLIDLAASLDRVERGSDMAAVTADPRLRLLREGIQLLAGSDKDRVVRMQMHFSDAYITGWRNELVMSS